MISFHKCLIITVLVVHSVNYSFTEELGSAMTEQSDQLLNMVNNFRSRRHTEFSDYQQPASFGQNKRNRGFLWKLKKKIMSFISGRKKHTNVAEEIEDESVNNLDLSKETSENKLQESSTNKEDLNKNLNLDLAARLAKMLENYESVLNTIQNKTLKNKNYHMTSNENYEITGRQKRHSNKSKHRGHHFRKKNQDMIEDLSTTKRPTKYLYADDPTNMKIIQQLKKRKRLIKSFMKFGAYDKAKKILDAKEKTKRHRVIKKKEDSLSQENLEHKY